VRTRQHRNDFGPERSNVLDAYRVTGLTAGADARRREDLVDVLPLLARRFSGDALGTYRNNSQQPDRNQIVEHHLFILQQTRLGFCPMCPPCAADENPLPRRCFTVVQRF